MKIVVRYARKLIVLVIGLPLLGLGLILIPLPGPGLLVVFLAVFILSLEFAWFDKHRARLEVKIKKIVSNAKEKREKPGR